MRKIPVLCCCSGMVLIAVLLFCSSFRKPVPAAVYFPYREAGLTAPEAAAHLLSRFTYGATPEDIDAAVRMGLEQWFLQQLQADLPDEALQVRLRSYDALGLSNTDVCRIYPTGAVVRKMAVRDSAISKDSVGLAVNKQAFNEQLKKYMDAHGIKPDQELYQQFVNQNILRAVYSRNQLEAVMTAFWFNHFNVSFVKGESAQFIPAYERDVIAPHALGRFDSMVLATAQSPAMLTYLDNATSVGSAQTTTPAVVAPVMEEGVLDTPGSAAAKKPLAKNAAALKGLNENYARELMELHTLGVDGGYTQQDVTEAARILTGWTLYPLTDLGTGSLMKKTVDRIGADQLSSKGYVHVQDFLFTPNRHDPGSKEVLGHAFPGGKDPALGYQEGLDLIRMLAHHPSTAKFICHKLAVRFVCDDPPKALLDKMQAVFLKSGGDIKQVLLCMVSDKAFWDKKNVQVKIKSPFEYAVSAVRLLHADISDPLPLFVWIAKMGERSYSYPAPTGFPDRKAYWINSGTLLNRMNFGMLLASGRLKGVTITGRAFETDLKAGKKDNAQAVATIAHILLPERNTDQLEKELPPILQSSGLSAAQEEQAEPDPVPLEKADVGAPGDMMLMNAIPDTAQQNSGKIAQVQPTTLPSLQVAIAGMIIGSPQFQQR